MIFLLIFSYMYCQLDGTLKGIIITIVSKRETIAAVFVVVLLVASGPPLGLAFSSTTPSFSWSNVRDALTTEKVKEAVNYQTLSPKGLVESVISEGGWSNLLREKSVPDICVNATVCKPYASSVFDFLLCSDKKPEESVDIAIVFVGRESVDISGRRNEDQKLLDLLKVSFTKSTFSLAYPYVAASEENKPLQTSLVSGFAETCGNDAELKFEKLADISSVQEYVVLYMEKKSKGQTPFLVYSNEQPRSEGQVLTELISSVEKTGAKYLVLYVSDHVNVIRYPSYRQVDRFLAEKSGNSSRDLNSTKGDGVCQIKSSLLEGLFVGLILLVILISGLCCMAGIDTPTRFEATQES